jgi:hypothetical protein
MLWMGLWPADGNIAAIRGVGSSPVQPFNASPVQPFSSSTLQLGFLGGLFLGQEQGD